MTRKRAGKRWPSGKLKPPPRPEAVDDQPPGAARAASPMAPGTYQASNGVTLAKSARSYGFEGRKEIRVGKKRQAKVMELL